MGPARLPPVAALAAACAGMAAWFTRGTLTITERGARAARIGLLPPVWALAACVAVAVVCAWAVRLSADRARPLFFSAILILPWLPVAVPPSVLAWTGPVSWLVWAAIAAAVVSAGTPRAPRSRPSGLLTDGRRAPLAAFACAAIVYGSAAWRLAPLVPGGDEPHYLVIAQSLWRDGDLTIENNHQRGDYLEYFGGALRPDYLRRGQDGQIYSIHLPGLPAVIAPVLALGGYGLVKAFLALLSAGAAAVAWRTAFLVTGSAAAAWFGWAATALTVPFLLLSFTVYPDGAGGVVVALAFAAVAGLTPRSRRSRWWWVAVGLLPAMLPWFHPRFAVLAAALGLVLGGRALRAERPVAALVSLAAAPVLSAAGWFGYYYSIYGRFNPAAAYGHYTQMSAGRIPIGLLGLFFDQQYGLLIYAPVFAVGIAGLVALYRVHRRLAIEWLAIVVPYTVVTAAYYMWWGGFSSPARFIGATLLIFSLPAATAWAEARRAATRSLQWVALGASLAIALGLVSVEGGSFVFNVRDTVAPALVWAGRVADLAHGVPGLFRLAPTTALAEASVWALAVAAAWLAARAIGGGGGRLTPGSVALVVLCALGAAASLALASAWRLEGVDGLSATAGQVRALDAARRGQVAHGMTFDPVALMDVDGALERLRIGLDREPGAPQDAWLWVPGLPAGRYRLWVDRASGAGPVDVGLVAGRADGPFDSWQIDGAAPGASSREFVLPVGLASIALKGSMAAHASVREAWLQPLPPAGGAAFFPGVRAASAGRLGAATVFAVRNVYLEPGGLWTSGGTTAELVVSANPDAGRIDFTMRGGPVPTAVDIEGASAPLQVTLAPGETRTLTIPVRRDKAALVRIRTDRGFRPASTDPVSRDTRLLGVRLEPKSEARDGAEVHPLQAR